LGIGTRSNLCSSLQKEKEKRKKCNLGRRAGAAAAAATKETVEKA
jgi:hypothetical protein